MNKKVYETIKRCFPVFSIILFSVISSLCLFFTNDDYLWYFTREKADLNGYINPNGRYVSNFITYVIVRYPAVRFIFYSFSLMLLLIILGKLIDFDKLLKEKKYYFVLTIFLMLPSITFAEVVNWISGYTNYAFAFLLTGLYIFFTFKIAFDNYAPKKITAPLFFFLSLAGGLCVEHVTVYNFIYSVAIIIIIYKLRKKVFIHSLSYMAGTIVSAIFMFNDSIYSQINAGNDQFGVRKFHLNIADAMFNAYMNVVTHYAKQYWIVSVVITVCLALILYKSDVKKYKYAQPCMAVCWLYLMYSVFTSAFATFHPTSTALKIRAVEFAFCFIYIVSLIYLIYALFDKFKRLRCFIYLFSTLAVSGPFVFVQPVTARCFFVNYMFWLLLAGEFFSAAFGRLNFFNSELMRRMLILSSTAMLVFISGIDITNHYYDTLRFKYLHEQAENNARRYIICELPYGDYIIDDFYEKNGSLFVTLNNVYGTERTWMSLICEYYDLDIDLDDFKYDIFSTEDFNELLSE